MIKFSSEKVKLLHQLMAEATGLIGVISAYALRDIQFDPRLLLFLRVGICGGFTTFSTFSLDTVEMLRTGAYLSAVLYMVLSVVLCLVATVGGQLLVR